MIKAIQPNGRRWSLANFDILISTHRHIRCHWRAVIYSRRWLWLFYFVSFDWNPRKCETQFQHPNLMSSESSIFVVVERKSVERQNGSSTQMMRNVNYKTIIETNFLSHAILPIRVWFAIVNSGYFHRELMHTIVCGHASFMPSPGLWSTVVSTMNEISICLPIVFRFKGVRWLICLWNWGEMKCAEILFLGLDVRAKIVNDDDDDLKAFPFEYTDSSAHSRNAVFSILLHRSIPPSLRLSKSKKYDVG